MAAREVVDTIAAPIVAEISVYEKENNSVVTPQLSPRGVLISEKVSPPMASLTVPVAVVDVEEDGGPVLSGLLCPRNTIVEDDSTMAAMQGSYFDMEALMESPSRAVAKIYESLLSPRGATAGGAVMDILSLLSPRASKDDEVMDADAGQPVSPSRRNNPVSCGPIDSAIPSTEMDLVTSFVSDDGGAVGQAVLGDLMESILSHSPSDGGHIDLPQGDENDPVPAAGSPMPVVDSATVEAVPTQPEAPLETAAPTASMSSIPTLEPIPVLAPEEPVETAPKAFMVNLTDETIEFKAKEDEVPKRDQPELYTSLLKPPMATIDYDAIAESVVPAAPVESARPTPRSPPRQRIQNASPKQKKKCFCF
jgi:hypothetical protein